MGFVQESRKVRLDSSGYSNHCLARDTGSLRVQPINALGIPAVAIGLSLVIIVHPLWVILLAGIIGFYIFASIEDECVPWNILYRNTEYVNYYYSSTKNGYGGDPITSKHLLNNPIMQEALNDMLDERKRLGDHFRFSDWQKQFQELNAALQEQFELEQESLNSIGRTDYAALVKQTNEFMRNSLKPKD